MEEVRRRDSSPEGCTLVPTNGKRVQQRLLQQHRQLGCFARSERNDGLAPAREITRCPRAVSSARASLDCRFVLPRVDTAALTPY